MTRAIAAAPALLPSQSRGACASAAVRAASVKAIADLIKSGKTDDAKKAAAKAAKGIEDLPDLMDMFKSVAKGGLDIENDLKKADPKKAAELGIRAAHADAPSIRVKPGATYELELRTTGEFTLRPLEAAVDGAEGKQS